MEFEKKSNKKKMIMIGVIVIVVIICGILGSVLYTNSEGYKVKKSLELGNKYLTEIQYEQAIAVFKEILEIEPENAEAKAAIVEAYLEIIDDGICGEVSREDRTTG
jgi:Tfp pilus assembly protein PilF